MGLSWRRAKELGNEQSTTIGKSRGSSSKTCMCPDLRREGH